MIYEMKNHISNIDVVHFKIYIFEFTKRGAKENNIKQKHYFKKPKFCKSLRMLKIIYDKGKSWTNIVLLLGYYRHENVGPHALFTYSFLHSFNQGLLVLNDAGL